MTDDEVRAFVGKPVRLELADGRILAGVLEASGDHGHGHVHYAVSSDPVRQGQPASREVIHGATAITNIEDASGDPAATMTR